MTRLRGPKMIKPEGEKAWAILNELVFGDNATGGQDVAVRPEILPIDWSQVFGRDARMGLEIGFNRGRFLRGLATRHPDRNFIGIEIQRRFCWRLANQLGASETPNNLRILWADAKLVTPTLFPKPTFDDIYITFPDPWWKRRHAKRRLVDTRFASELARIIKDDRLVWVKSDVPAISEEIAEALASTQLFTQPEKFEADELPLTHREAKCIDQGLPIYRFQVRRNPRESSTVDAVELTDKI